MEKIPVVFLYRLENKLLSGELIKVTEAGFFCIKCHDHRFYWISDSSDIRWVETYEDYKKYEDIKYWSK